MFRRCNENPGKPARSNQIQPGRLGTRCRRPIGSTGISVDRRPRPLDFPDASAFRNFSGPAFGALAILCHCRASDRIRRRGGSRPRGTSLAGRGPPPSRRWLGHPGRFRRIAPASRLRRLPEHLGALAERFLLVRADRRRASPDRGRSRDSFAAPRRPATTSQTDRLKTSLLTLRSRGWVVFMRATTAD